MRIKDILYRLLLVLLFFSVLNESAGCNDETGQVPGQQNLLPTKENMWVFIMAGQSNMAGRGKIEAQE